MCVCACVLGFRVRPFFRSVTLEKFASSPLKQEIANTRCARVCMCVVGRGSNRLPAGVGLEEDGEIDSTASHHVTQVTHSLQRITLHSS